MLSDFLVSVRQFTQTLSTSKEKKANVKFKLHLHSIQGLITETKTKYYIRFGVLGIIFLIAILANGFFLHPRIDQTYIPTVINGITASTSIVIGFTGVVMGLFYRDVFAKDEKMKSMLMGLTLYLAIPIAYLLTVYAWLVVVDFDSSLKIAFTGLILSLFIFIFMLFFVGYNLEKNQQRQSQKSLCEWQN
jgi:glucan phosphoethanolaminetransferase (alkaline phosphatase superfamily)